MAVMAGVESAVQVHIDRGDDLNARDARGMTPLMLSAARNKHAICKLLLSAGADRGLLDPAGKTALEIAIAAGATEAARILGANIAPPTDCAGPATARDPVSSPDIGASPPNPDSVCWPSHVIELDDGGEYDLSGWEAEEETAAPDADTHVLDSASAVQIAITAHAPIDSSVVNRPGI